MGKKPDHDPRGCAICAAGGSHEEGLKDFMRIQRDLINKHGWAVVGITATGIEALSYSVGMAESLNHPDIVITGLAPEQAKPLINNLGASIRAKEARFDVNGLNDRALSGYSAAMMSIPPDIAARSFKVAYGVMAVPPRFMQLVWPDTEGRFPWHPQYRGPIQKVFHPAGVEPALLLHERTKPH